MDTLFIRRYLAIIFILLFNLVFIKAENKYSINHSIDNDIIIDIDSIDIIKDYDTLGIDTTIINNEISKSLERHNWIPNSKHAMLWALLPGGGQIYNRKYWKLPIVYGAFTTCFYAINFNQSKYKEYHEAYRDMSSEDPSKNTAWLAFTPNGTLATDYQQYSYLKDTFRRGDEYFRRWRDLSIVASLAIYGLSILDAYVDAELATFDISEDLSMKVYPLVSNSINNYNINVSVGCSLYF